MNARLCVGSYTEPISSRLAKDSALTSTSALIGESNGNGKTSVGINVSRAADDLINAGEQWGFDYSPCPQYVMIELLVANSRVFNASALRPTCSRPRAR